MIASILSDIVKVLISGFVRVYVVKETVDGMSFSGGEMVSLIDSKEGWIQLTVLVVSSWD